MATKQKSNNKSKKRKDDNFFQYALTLVLNYSEIKERELENIFKKLNMKI